MADTVYLYDNDWDDYSFQTIFQAVYIDRAGARRQLGAVKIGEYGLQPGRGPNLPAGFGRPAVPGVFPELDKNRFFSLGQDSTYYENINELDDEVGGFRERYLGAINDIAFRDHLLDDVLSERVTQRSLLRTVSVATIRDQFSRLARGSTGPVGYNLDFPIRDEFGSPTLRCAVEPNSLPPENIRVLIGRNGAGKSTTLRHIENMLINGARDAAVELKVARQRAQLAKLVSVSFSAFDAFKHLSDGETGIDNLTYYYVGLQCEQAAAPVEGETENFDPCAPQPEPVASQRRTRTSDELTEMIVEKVAFCSSVDELRERLSAALRIIEGDPNFAEFGITAIVDGGGPSKNIRSALQLLVEPMSSGHKIVLLTLARLVETVAEKTLVLFDEPESHLHPPLLSALVRALSDLLADRNGLAIIATHSPVVLQEVPKSCVFIIENTPVGVTLNAPELETFGENVGTLTAAVFGLEVTRTGFYAMLQNVADTEADYPAALRRFHNQLGAEGRAILRSIITTRTPHADDVGN